MTGETILHYKILEKLGEGGMGVVYKAEDTKLKRTVALKFLPPHLAASEGDKARFVQEAQAASALNHPNVCTIHDIQEQGGPDGSKQMFIVMEYVVGQTLRDMMGGKSGTDAGAGERTMVPLNRATEIGIQIAEGLAAAHEQGIVHRDIKPENIMVRKDGIAQIMDFGLAKLRSSTGSRLTQQGSTVGTAGYMSPEQIQGTDADHRSDVFSLGVVLYELLTGELPFKGVHETALLYEIVNVDPAPMTTINPELNPELDRIVFECLQKEQDERFQSVKDISKELKRYKRESGRQRATRTMATRQFPQTQGGSSAVSTVATVTAGPQKQPRALWKRFFWPGFSVVLAALLILFTLKLAGDDPTGGLPVMRFPINVTVTDPLVLGAATLAIAPDGRNMVYLAGERLSGILYLRPLDRLEAEPMSGSEGASDPFFSADGKTVAYFSAGQIHKISIFGGAPQQVCETGGFMRGGHWADDNMIWFGHLNRAIHRVPAAGGTPEEVTLMDTTVGEISHRFPQSLPGGKWVIFTVKFNNISSFDNAVIAAENVETHERKELVRGGSYGRYLPSGHLMYARGTAIYAVPFDPDRIEVTGPPLPVIEGGQLNQLSGTANFEVSGTGILIYTPLGPLSINNNVVGWMDRSGRLDPILTDPRPYFNPKISPDGRKVAVTIRAANDDIWVYDLDRGSMTRLTFGGGNSDLPVWTRDSRQIFYISERGRARSIFVKSADGAGQISRVGTSEEVSIVSLPTLTPDGRTVLFDISGDIFSMDTNSESGAESIIRTPAVEIRPALSPDGRHLAFLSDESGRFELYVTPYPSLDGKWQISTVGSISGGVWSPDGRELFYTESDKLMKVDVIQDIGIRFSPPQKVCDLPESIFSVSDISPDGKRFMVVLSVVRNIQATQVNVVTGWFTELGNIFSSIPQ